MSAFLPAPLTMVVFSLSIITFLARPSMASVTFSILMPRSSEIAEARSLDGCDLETATQTVDDEGGQGLAFDVLGDYHKRLATLHHGFQQRKQFIQLR